MNTIQTTERQKLAPGTILHDSWGYNMTINEYAVVLEDNGKTVLCHMVGKIVESDPGPTRPNKDVLRGQPFRLHPRPMSCNDGHWYVGSYPFVCGNASNGQDEYKHKGYFQVWDGKPKTENTWD